MIPFSRGISDVVYVDRPIAGCPDPSSGRALEARSTTTRLCRGGIVTVFDPITGTEFGGCSLGEFTPYRRTPPPG